MNDEGTCFVIGVLLAALVSFTLNSAMTVDSEAVVSGKQFIYHKATYQCKKTNELKTD